MDSQGQTGNLQTAVDQAMKLLGADQPERAREQANSILRHYPEEANSRFVVAAADRAAGDHAAAG